MGSMDNYFGALVTIFPGWAAENCCKNAVLYSIYLIENSEVSKIHDFPLMEAEKPMESVDRSDAWMRLMKLLKRCFSCSRMQQLVFCDGKIN